MRILTHHPKDTSFRDRNIKNSDEVSLLPPCNMIGDEASITAKIQAELAASEKNRKPDADAVQTNEPSGKRKFLNVFYALQRHAKRILSHDLDKEIKGRQSREDKEREQEFVRAATEQQLQQTRELGRLIEKEKGRAGNKIQKDLDEKQVRPAMHAVRAPGLQAGEILPPPKTPQGLKHDFSGKPAQAGLGMVAEELKAQSFAEQVKNRAKVDKGGVGGPGGL